MSDERENAIARFEDKAGLQPRTLKEAKGFANMLADSGLLPAQLRNKPADVLVIMLTGHRYGLDPMQSINSIDVIFGKPVLSSDLMRSLCQASPVCEYFRLLESTASGATYEAKRRGEPPVKMSFTVEDAKRAGLYDKKDSLWHKYPADMCRHRCKARLAREVFGDVVGGLYVSGELDESPARAVEAVTVEVTAEPPKPAKKRKPKAEPKAEPAPVEVVAEVVETAPAPTEDDDPFAGLDPAKASGW